MLDEDEEAFNATSPLSKELQLHHGLWATSRVSQFSTERQTQENSS